MHRRDFLKASLAALAGGSCSTLAAAEPVGPIVPRDPGILRHRFGVNYVPSKDWYFCWNDWDASAIARDFDRIAELGADHIRMMLIWPYFQPNQRWASPAHLDRLDELLRLAAQRNLDVLVTVYTGWLSGFHFNPPFLEQEPFYTSPKWAAAQDAYLDAVAVRMRGHGNFLGFDIGNEINCNWRCAAAQGDAWMARILGRMKERCPGRVHVNGVDHNPWFNGTTFSPQALVVQQDLVALHCWPFWTGARKHGGHLDDPYVRLPAAMAALARSFGGAPQKPMWLQEFGACSEEMPEADVPMWLEKTVRSAVAGGVSWFTWWASHDVDRRFDFHPFEYGLGLMTVDNRIKEQGRMFKRLADEFRGKAVVIPSTPLPLPPNERNDAATWKWLLAWMRPA